MVHKIIPHYAIWIKFLRNLLERRNALEKFGVMRFILKSRERRHEILPPVETSLRSKRSEEGKFRPTTHIIPGTY